MTILWIIAIPVMLFVLFFLYLVFFYEDEWHKAFKENAEALEVKREKNQKEKKWTYCIQRICPKSRREVYPS